MEVQGRIKMIGETQTFGGNGFRKREVVVTTDEQYPQHIMVEFVQDKTDLLNNYKEGQQVKISINLRGREWVNPQGETKYFNSIQGWRIEALQAESGDSSLPPVPPMDAFEPAGDLNEEDHDDLPSSCARRCMPNSRHCWTEASSSQKDREQSLPSSDKLEKRSMEINPSKRTRCSLNSAAICRYSSCLPALI